VQQVPGAASQVRVHFLSQPSLQDAEIKSYGSRKLNVLKAPELTEALPQ
jgi:hypothetical protein